MSEKAGLTVSDGIGDFDLVGSDAPSGGARGGLSGSLSAILAPYLLRRLGRL